MKKVVNPLIYLVKNRESLIITTNNLTQVTNRLYYYSEVDTSSKADRFVEKEMKDYPIYTFKKTENNHNWPESRQWDKM